MTEKRQEKKIACRLQFKS